MDTLVYSIILSNQKVGLNIDTIYQAITSNSICKYVVLL